MVLLSERTRERSKGEEGDGEEQEAGEARQIASETGAKIRPEDSECTLQDKL